MSQSVTSTGQNSVFLLQIKTFVGGDNSGDGHFSDVVVMKVSSTVLKHKQATRNTLARNRMLARLAKAAEQGMLFVTHDHAELMWLRRHVGTDDIAEPEPYLFCLQHDWDALTPTERALRVIKGLAEFHPDWAFWGYDAALLWGLEMPNDLLGPRYLVKTGCSVPLSAGCRLLRPQAAGALEQVDGVQVTSFWRTVEDCLLRAPFSYGLAIADSALRAKGVSRGDLCERLRADCEGRRGYRRARVIASHADGLSENGGESRFRAFFIAYGFPVPELQVEFHDPLDPSRSFRVDYFLEAHGRDVRDWRAGRKGEVCLTERRGSGVGRPVRGRASAGIPSDNARAQGASVYV